jgi:hypothetical protein
MTTGIEPKRPEDETPPAEGAEVKDEGELDGAELELVSGGLATTTPIRQETTPVCITTTTK